jgi:hypothetical protein
LGWVWGMNRSYVHIACCFCLFCPCLFTFLQNTYVVCTQDIARWEAYLMAKPTTLQMLDWSHLPSDKNPFSSWRGLFVPVLLRVGTVHPPPRFIFTLTTHQRCCPSSTSLTIMGRNNYLYPSTPVSLHLYPSTPVHLHLYPSICHSFSLAKNWGGQDKGGGWGRVKTLLVTKLKDLKI